MYRTVFWTLWEKARVGWSERRALKHVYYHIWNRLPVQIQCMRQGAQGWCTGMTLRDGMGREVGGGSGWGTHLHPWLIHANVWQKPLQYCKLISLQLKLINLKIIITQQSIPFWAYIQKRWKQNSLIQKDTCVPVFISALFTIAKTSKQSKCPLTDEWIQKMWYVYIHIHTHTQCNTTQS